MRLQVNSQFETEYLTDDGCILRQPKGDAEFNVECSVLKQTDASDLLVVDKTTILNGSAYRCRTRFPAADFLQCLATAGPCYSTSTVETVLGLKAVDLVCLVGSAHIWSDDREDIYFCFQRSPGHAPVLHKLRQKYYSADLRLWIRSDERGFLQRIYGCLRSDVILPAVGQPSEIDTKELLWFEVPQAMLLWTNNLVEVEEEGFTFWCRSSTPLLSRFQKISR